MRRTLLCAIAMVGCTEVTTVPAAPVYRDVNDELQAQVNELNRVLVRCWATPTCRGQHLITWTPWDSTMAPAFIVRRVP